MSYLQSRPFRSLQRADATILLFLIGLTSLGCSKERKSNSQSASVTVGCEVTLNVTGMTCGQGCPPRIERALNAVEGVASSTASYENGNAVVRCEQSFCAPDGHKKLVSAVQASGYDANHQTSMKINPKP